MSSLLVECKSGDNMNSLRAFTGVIEGSKLYVVDIVTSMLLEYNLDDFSYKVLEYDFLPMDWKGIPCRSILKQDNYLLCISAMFRGVYEYDLNTRKKCLYDNNLGNYPKETTYSSFIFDEKCWQFPYKNQFVEIFDLKTKQLSTISLSLPEDMLDSRAFETFTGFTRIRDEVFFCLYGTSYIGLFSLLDKKTTYYTIPGNMHIETLSSGGNDIWFSAENDQNIYRWNCKEGIIAKCHIESIDPQPGRKFRIFRMLERNNILLCTSFSSRDLALIDTQNNTVINTYDHISHQKNMPLKIYFGDTLFDGNRFIILPYKTEELTLVDPVNNKVERIYCALKSKDVMASLIHNGSYMFKEGTEQGLEDFFQGLQSII